MQLMEEQIASMRKELNEWHRILQLPLPVIARTQPYIVSSSKRENSAEESSSANMPRPASLSTLSNASAANTSLSRISSTTSLTAMFDDSALSDNENDEEEEGEDEEEEMTADQDMDDQPLHMSYPFDASAAGLSPSSPDSSSSSHPDRFHRVQDLFSLLKNALNDHRLLSSCARLSQQLSNSSSQPASSVHANALSSILPSALLSKLHLNESQIEQLQAVVAVQRQQDEELEKINQELNVLAQRADSYLRSVPSESNSNTCPLPSVSFLPSTPALLESQPTFIHDGIDNMQDREAVNLSPPVEASSFPSSSLLNLAPLSDSSSHYVDSYDLPNQTWRMLNEEAGHEPHAAAMPSEQSLSSLLCNDVYADLSLANSRGQSHGSDPFAVDPWLQSNEIEEQQ